MSKNLDSVKHHGGGKAGRCDGEERTGGANLDEVVKKGFPEEGTVIDLLFLTSFQLHLSPALSHLWK